MILLLQINLGYQDTVFYLKEICPRDDLREGARVHHEIKQFASTGKLQDKNDHLLLQSIFLHIGERLTGIATRPHGSFKAGPEDSCGHMIWSERRFLKITVEHLHLLFDLSLRTKEGSPA